ncbi:metabolite traffic protein EboE [Pedobacter sp. SAFR-022]|uniref:metabolite traffic protein EboE n=1 Tax=Pedobacter sp. SAFR-022 TaxID=3436861 RepID=UPI003F7F2768
MKTKSGHLSYCTNIHAGKDWSADFENLKTHFPEVKAAISPTEPMGIGLRLSNTASITLADPAAQDEFKRWLQENQAYVFTMNGFPYGEFHHTVVKADVHSPDWTTAARKDYTIRLAQLLTGLLPEAMDGGISTSPLSYRHWFHTADALNAAVEMATMNILEVVKELISIYRETGKLIHLDLEPEPDGVIESGPEYISWYDTQLLRIGIPLIAGTFSLNDQAAESLIKQHLCLCYDVCHFSIGYEDHAAVLEQLKTKGLKVGKIQISAALKGKFSDEAHNQAMLQDFEKFNEPTYLHQVVAKDAAGKLTRYPDLDEALADFHPKAAAEWRAHFHVPVSTDRIGQLYSTRDDIVQVLKLQKQAPFTNHLEVETYTWEVLPEGLKIPIAQSISNELEWVINHAIK